MSSRSKIIMSLILLVVTGFLLAFTGLWYLQAIPAAALGYYILRSRSLYVLAGVFSVMGMLIAIFSYDAGYRLGNGSLVAGIIGFPGGYLIPLAMTIIVLFVLCIFG
ncbi:MAG: hypothetical protein M1529_01550, partial [Candidatus Thermoplasmatota archaeon]|nr:hypothetical protein [Candidatus Thermoplasmatota archaeon]